MALKLYHAAKPCVEWKTELPHTSIDNKESSSFNLYDITWSFVLERTWNNEKREETWNVYIKQCLPLVEDYLSFVVTTYIKDENGKLNQMLKISRGSGNLKCIFWFGTSLLSEQYPDVLMNNKIAFLFTFNAPLKNITDLKEDTDKEEQFLQQLSIDTEKLLFNKEYSDVTLKCGGQKFLAHRNILSARCPVLAEVMKSENSESPVEVDIIDMNPPIMELFLRYIYSGRIDAALTIHTAADLYQVAYNYQVPSLKRHCALFLVENLTESSFCSVVLLADGFHDLQLMAAAVAFLTEREDFFESGLWSIFEDEQPALAVKVFEEYSRYKRREPEMKE